MAKLPPPKIKKEIRRSLGMTGDYSRDRENYALIPKPITREIKGQNKKIKITWSDEIEKATENETLKSKFREEPIRYAHNYNLKLVKCTDISQKGIIVGERKGKIRKCTPSGI